MPYVNESKVDNRTYFPVAGSGSGVPLSTAYTSSMDSAVQYGWRSGGELDAANADLDSRPKRHWADTISLIEAYDRIDSAMSHPKLLGKGVNFDVHERTYTEESRKAATPKVKIHNLSTGGLSYTGQPSLMSSASFLSLPSDTGIRSIGSNMLRESRPTKPQANLGQWFGELGQFGGMFDVPRELPEELAKYADTPIGELRRLGAGGNAVGSGYLASQFGWLPFLGEVFNSLDTIAHSGKLLDDFAANSARLIQRKRQKVVYQDAATVSGVLAGGGVRDTIYTASFAQLGVSVNLHARKSLGLDSFRFRYDTTVTRVDSYRTSAIFEYFVADPKGFLSTAKRYSQEAKYLLGDPLISLSTLWELTPWSWAIDWSFNLGSLLSFQESVATDGLVMRRASTVFERVVSIVTHWEPFYNGALVASSSGNLISVTTLRQQRRLEGSPYDMGIDWSGFSTQKWFILGAVGITHAPGIKPS